MPQEMRFDRPDVPIYEIPQRNRDMIFHHVRKAMDEIGRGEVGDGVSPNGKASNAEGRRRQEQFFWTDAAIKASDHGGQDNRIPTSESPGLGGYQITNLYQSAAHVLALDDHDLPLLRVGDEITLGEATGDSIMVVATDGNAQYPNRPVTLRLGCGHEVEFEYSELEDRSVRLTKAVYVD